MPYSSGPHIVRTTAQYHGEKIIRAQRDAHAQFAPQPGQTGHTCPAAGPHVNSSLYSRSELGMRCSAAGPHMLSLPGCEVGCVCAVHSSIRASWIQSNNWATHAWLGPGLSTAVLLPLVQCLVPMWPSCQGATDQELRIPD